MAKTWVALIRGINLGPHKRVAMADLRALLESLGFDSVRTHLQSGNAVFTGAGRARDIERQLEASISKELGVEAKVLVRTADELEAVVSANPFVARKVAQKELHAAFLSGQPAAKELAGLDGDEYSPDQFEVGDRVIYLRLPNGVMGSRLPNWEKVLGVTATTRNWNTVSRVRDLASG